MYLKNVYANLVYILWQIGDYFCFNFQAKLKVHPLGYKINMEYSTTFQKQAKQNSQDQNGKKMIHTNKVIVSF